MRNVLMIAPYFPPRQRVGSLRPMRFARYLPSFGWRPTVVTLRSGQTMECDHANDKDLRIIRINSPWDFTQSDATPKQRVEMKSETSRIVQLVDDAFPVDTWLPVLGMNVLRLIKEARRTSPDVVWSTADPWSSHVLAGLLSRSLGVPWVADFRDPWTLCPVRNRRRLSVTRRIDRWVESGIVRLADLIIFTARTTELMYKSVYGSDLKTDTIYNSFDDSVEQEADSIELNPEGFHIAFFGRFRPLSPATRIIDVLTRVKELDPNLALRISVHSFGAWTDADTEHARRAGVSSMFRFHRPVQPDQSRSVLRLFDCLLISTEADRDDIIPAKLWDYLPLNAPILSLCDNSEIAELLRKTGRGRQFGRAETEEAARWICDRSTVRRDGPTRPLNTENVQSYHARRTTAALASHFDRLIRDGDSR
jgi:hypothetical protein